jgi:predicted transcriptional regulator YheO
MEWLYRYSSSSAKAAREKDLAVLCINYNLSTEIHCERCDYLDAASRSLSLPQQ